MNVLSNQDGHVAIASCILPKAGPKSMEELPKPKQWCMARKLAPGYPRKHIWRKKVTHNHNWREWGHYKMAGITIEFYRFFIFDMITLICNSGNFVLNLLNFDQLTKTISRCEILEMLKWYLFKISCIFCITRYITTLIHWWIYSPFVCWSHFVEN